MELRRALLLFAIVLGLAAIASSYTRPAPERGASTEPGAPRSAGAPPRAEARPAAPPPPEVVFGGGHGMPATEHLRIGRAVTVTVRVPEPGQVELGGLGLSKVADPLTPARFDVLAARRARHVVRLLPASGAEPQTIGVLAVGRPKTRSRQRESPERGP